MSKYKNKKKTVLGITFDSGAEAERYLYLWNCVRKGTIKNLRRQVEYELIPKQKLPEPELRGNRREIHLKSCKYKADFVYERDGKTIVEDVKGYRTANFEIKRKLMLWVHGIQVKVVRM